jgi:hypothetical protein
VIDRTPAERLERALDARVAVAGLQRDPELAALVEMADLLRRALPRVPAGPALERRLADRLAPGHPVARRLRTIGRVARHELRHPGALVLTGAVSSLAVGCLTAIAVRRGTRRSAAFRALGR